MSWHLLQSYQTVQYDQFDIVVTFFDDQLYVTASGSLGSKIGTQSVNKTTLIRAWDQILQRSIKSVISLLIWPVILAVLTLLLYTIADIIMNDIFSAI